MPFKPFRLLVFFLLLPCTSLGSDVTWLLMPLVLYHDKTLFLFNVLIVAS